MKFSRFFLPTMFSFLIVLPNFVQSETRKICEARRTVQPPVIDGHLDESMWLQYEPITGLIQLSPEPGQPCSQKSQIWVFFDEQNIYVAAILYDEPENVTNQ
ncbi:MAG: hypothetical protein HQ568_01215, partial [Calditrichaeota bacterium]|nr:hypothetical protein [Calditrichota bacterium]